MTETYASYGDVLAVGDGLGAYTAIAEVKDFNLPEEVLDLWEATNHDSPNGREDFLPTILRSGQIQFDINLIPAHATHMNGTRSLRQLLNTRTRAPFRITLNDEDNTEIDFDAYVVRFNGTSQVTSGGMASCALKPVGDVVTTQD